MTVIFDGKAFAEKKLEVLKNKVFDLRKRGVTPKLVSILVGDDPASHLYVNLKKKAAERVGAELDVRSLSAQAGMMSDVGKEEIVQLIKSLNKDQNINGIMIQLPLPKSFSIKDRDEIINSINKEKDVDGLREDSLYLTPTVKAVLEVIKEASALPLRVRPLRVKRLSESVTYKVVVVGARGFEGRKIFKALKEMPFLPSGMGYEVKGVDKKTQDLKLKTRRADILISVTGSPGIIDGDCIKQGAVVIDVGSPKGDVRTEEIKGKASFISPVPGGVGPVTISCLLENLTEAVKRQTG